MDRLSALIALAALGCDKTDAPPPPSRVEGAAGAQKKQANTDAFCDVHPAGDSGPALTFPPLAGGASPPAAQAGHWRWVNVWATWCKPCVEEMPRLTRWREKLTGGGHPIDLVFVSVDESDADVAAFRKDHADTPPSVRLADVTPEKQAAWFTALGLDAGPPIPIHVFVSPRGHAAGVREQDFAAIEKLLGE
jgi:thiol-disulfide isomerase/thioredoxin